MPTINRLQKKSRTSSGNTETEAKEIRRKAYNNTQWRKLREVYIREHALCEECLKKGKVTPAEDIHHKKSPFRDGAINYQLLLDYNNLEAVCKECHQHLHNAKEGYKSPEEVLRQLDALFDQDNVTDKDIEDGAY